MACQQSACLDGRRERVRTRAEFTENLMPSFHFSRGRPRVLVLASALCAAGAHGQTAPAVVALERVAVEGRHYDNAVGSSDAASEGVIRAELLKSRPALRPGEVLEFVPGLIVTQHSGDGKANQYFLRGFNLDHGLSLIHI